MASCNLCHLWGRTTDVYSYRSCSVCANGRGREFNGRKGAFTDPVCKHAPSSVPTEHDPGWASVLIRTRGVLDGSTQWTTLHTSALCLNAKLTVPHSWCLLWILRFSSEFLLCWFPCSLNSFSVFGLYISARLQIIWRPHLWLVWSFTQMVSFLEFSTSNPVSPPSPHLFITEHLLNANAPPPHLILIITNNRLTSRHQWWLHFSPQLSSRSTFSCMPINHPSESLLLSTSSSLHLSSLTSPIKS